MGCHHLQKHERACIRAAKEVLEPSGIVLNWEQRGAKIRLYARVGPKILGQKVVSSSPRDPKSDLNFTRQWAQRLVERR